MAIRGQMGNMQIIVKHAAPYSSRRTAAGMSRERYGAHTLDEFSASRRESWIFAGLLERF
jgi:hypothetical protein